MNNEQLGEYLGKIVKNYNERMMKEPDMNLYQPLQDVYNMKHDMEAEQERRASIKDQVNAAIAKTAANDKQVGGDHYQNKAIQPWDYIVANNLGYLEGNVVKYVSRWKEKHGLEDLKKARHYLDKLIETVRK